MAGDKSNSILESVGRELKTNRPAIVKSTERKFGVARAKKQNTAILLSKARKLGARVPKTSKVSGGY